MYPKATLNRKVKLKRWTRAPVRSFYELDPSYYYEILCSPGPPPIFRLVEIVDAILPHLSDKDAANFLDVIGMGNAFCERFLEWDEQKQKHFANGSSTASSPSGIVYELIESGLMPEASILERCKALVSCRFCGDPVSRNRSDIPGVCATCILLTFYCADSCRFCHDRLSQGSVCDYCCRYCGDTGEWYYDGLCKDCYREEIEC